MRKQRKGFSNTDRTILLVAAIGVILSGFLFFNENILDQFDAGAGESIGIIEQSTKDVRRKIQKQVSWTPANLNDSVAYGDSIFTGVNSTAKVRLQDGGEVNVAPNSLIVFKPQQRGADGKMQASLDLQFGEVISRISPQSTFKLNLNGKAVEISSSADATIKLSSEGKIKVISGKISVKSANKITSAPVSATTKDGLTNLETSVQELTITDSVATAVESSKPTEIESKSKTIDEQTMKTELLNSDVALEPVVFAPEPIVESNALAKDIKEESSDVEITIVNDKILHRLPSNFNPRIQWKTSIPWNDFVVETSTNAQFVDKKEFPVTGHEFLFTDYTVGRYFFRVKAVKEQTLIRMSGLGQLLVRSAALAINKNEPIIVATDDPRSVAKPVATKVTWNALGVAKSYELEVSKNENFKDKKSIVARSPASQVTLDQPGNYYVRVRPLDADGSPLASFSPAENLEYIFKSPLAAPALIGPAANSTLFFQRNKSMPFWLEWEVIERASRYNIEVSRDPQFRKTLLQLEAKSNRYLLSKRLPAGELYWRVKATTDTNESVWSPPQKFKIISGRGKR